MLVEELVKHARQLHRSPLGLFYRFSADANRAIRGTDTTIYFWPRIRPHPVIKFLSQINDSARVRVAASHIRAGEAADVMIGLARRGATLEILAESTPRRVTPKVERRLASAGIRFRRIKNPEHLPMHLKFVLVEESGQSWSIFGSFNWTKPSFWLNHEIAAISNDPMVFKAFANRWDVLESERG